MSNPTWKSIVLSGDNNGKYTQTWVLEIPQGYVVKNLDWHGNASMAFVPDSGHVWNPGEIDPLDPPTKIFDGLFLNLTHVVTGSAPPGIGGPETISTWIPTGKIVMMQSTTSGPNATTIFLDGGQKIDVKEQMYLIRSAIGAG